MPDNRPVITLTPEIPSIAGQIEAYSRVLTFHPSPQKEVDQWEWKNYFVPKLTGSGFDPRFIVPSLKFHPEQEKVFRLTKSKCQNVGAIVALIGVRGVGKTAIGAQLAIERLREWKSYFHQMPEDRQPRAPLGLALYRKMSQVVMSMKVLYSDYGSIDTERQMRERDTVTDRSLLIIDELHDCDDQKMKNRILTDIVDIRYANNRDTVLISNQSHEEFQSTTTDSILSRLSEHGCIIPCAWASFR